MPPVDFVFEAGDRNFEGRNLRFHARDLGGQALQTCDAVALPRLLFLFQTSDSKALAVGRGGSKFGMTETELSTAGGTSDARFIAQYCPVVELGLPGQTMHKVDERVAIADVKGLAELYAAFIAMYFSD